MAFNLSNAEIDEAIAHERARLRQAAHEMGVYFLSPVAIYNFLTMGRSGWVITGYLQQYNSASSDSAHVEGRGPTLGQALDAMHAALPEASEDAKQMAAEAEVA